MIIHDVNISRIFSVSQSDETNAYDIKDINGETNKKKTAEFNFPLWWATENSTAPRLQRCQRGADVTTQVSVSTFSSFVICH